MLTIALLLLGSELTARHFFYGQEKDSCQVSDSKLGFKFRANCTSRTKANEGPWVVNYYNDCGYRSKESCGPKPQGAIRIALVGSSVAQGWNVPYERTFATRTAAELTKRCGRPVEVQNLGRQQCSVACMFHRVDEALALKPDVLVVAISPYDIETILPNEVRDRYKPIQPEAGAAESLQKGLLIKKIENAISDSRTVVAVEHFLFADPSAYLQMYLAYGDKADFLRSPLSPAWEQRFKNVDLLLGEMAQKAKTAHTSFVVIEVPNLPQASALLLPKPVPNVNPDAINQRLEEISGKYGITFVNVLDTFRLTPGSNRFFYLTGGHLNGDGDALVSRPLIEQLTEGSHAPLASCVARAQQSSGTGF
jgi:hypothetical protein